MKAWRLYAFLLCLTTACASPQPSSNEGPTSSSSWTLVWSDEFNTPGYPDSKNWSYETGNRGWGNQELEMYTNQLKNARVENGHLVIEAKHEDSFTSHYDSARLVSKNKVTVQYGRVEVRALLPTGRGVWPAIWMMPNKSSYGNHGWPDNGEIDIMEQVGFDPDTIHGSLHCNAYNWPKHSQKTATITVKDATTAYHVYALEWTPDSINLFVDSKKFFTFNREQGSDWRKWPFDKPFFIILNVAVGGFWGGEKGIDNAIFPQEMLIDYVRVFQANNQANNQAKRP
jgi:beta-glucanase (GH16 family)